MPVRPYPAWICHKMNAIEFKARIYRSILSVFGKLPLKALYKIGDFISWVMRNVISYRKGVIYTNLARSFPEKRYDEIDAIAKDYYRHLGEIAAETVWFGGCNGNGDKLHRQKIYEYVNPEVLIEANRDRGVFCMTSHCGNWELLGGIYEYSYTVDLHKYIDMDNFYVAFRPMYNKVSDKVFYENRRAPLPQYNGQIEDMKMLRHAVMHKDSKPIYVLIADQYPYKACHYLGLFLNQHTVGMLGGFALAAKLGFAILYMRQERVDRGHYRLTYEVITENASGQDPEKLMRKYFDMLEEDIRRQPSNWLWSHKRWK